MIKKLIQYICKFLGITPPAFVSPSPEQQKLNAEIEYRKQRRALERNRNEIHTVIEHFKTMAVTSEREGRHSDAIQCAKYVHSLNAGRDKITSILQKQEMLHALHGYSDIMVRFMYSCSALGESMNLNIDFSKIAEGQASIDASLQQLDLLDEYIDSTMASIDNGAESIKTFDGETEDLLRKIMAENQSIETAESSAQPKISPQSEVNPALSDSNPLTVEELNRRIMELSAAPEKEVNNHA